MEKVKNFQRNYLESEKFFSKFLYFLERENFQNPKSDGKLSWKWKIFLWKFFSLVWQFQDKKIHLAHQLLNSCCQDKKIHLAHQLLNSCCYCLTQKWKFSGNIKVRRNYLKVKKFFTKFSQLRNLKVTKLSGSLQKSKSK